MINLPLLNSRETFENLPTQKRRFSNDIEKEPNNICSSFDAIEEKNNVCYVFNLYLLGVFDKILFDYYVSNVFENLTKIII